MKRTQKAFLAAPLLFAAVVVQGLADDEKAAPDIDAVLQEIKSLRLKIEQLEMRIEMLESRGSQQLQHDGPVRIGFPTDASSKRSPAEASEVFQREGGVPSRFEWHRHEMPWLPFPTRMNDKGLYVFPGLDAPPSSPMDVLSR